MRSKSKLALALFAATIGASAFTSSAYAAACKNVRIEVINNRAQEIKVTRAEYYDTEATKWRNENLGTWKTAPQSGEYKTKKLEYVKNQQVKMKLKWAYNTGGSQWSSWRYTPVSSNQYCSGGQTYTFTIN